MATLDTEIHITELPIEVLEHIFSYLRLADRKSVSLVCQLWNELIFSRRFMRNVALNIVMDWEHSQISVLKRSTRLYRNVFAFFGPETCCEFDFTVIIEVLDLFGATLESFHCMTNFTIDQLWNVVTRAPNLRQLIVGVDAASLNLDLPDFPVLQHLSDMGSLINVLRIVKLAVPNLKQLSANFIKPDDAHESLPFLRQVAPRLKNLELFSTEYFIPINELRFPEVEVLKLCGRICNASDGVLKQFFLGFKCLTEVYLDFSVKGPVLDVITKDCPEIVKLHFKTYLLDSESFRLLERLKRLKTLSLAGSIDFRTTSECKPLALRHLDQLEELTLKCIHTPVAFMLSNKSLRRLKIKYFHNLTDADLYKLSQMYPNLKYLEVVWCRKITQSGIAKFQSQLTDCVVHHSKL
ncbi:uncharacterized protein LOC135710238 [Ochlerotatus camptorhynchus]|uniref:uncharacterized protein LOC135710238 n=1 Tax=Ochlerotatus camptorhynchus TaxID=644619 RepID=UPI0031D695E3